MFEHLMTFTSVLPAVLAYPEDVLSAAVDMVVRTFIDLHTDMATCWTTNIATLSVHRDRALEEVEVVFQKDVEAWSGMVVAAANSVLRSNPDFVSAGGPPVPTFPMIEELLKPIGGLV